jgi:hypothetical protein
VTLHELLTLRRDSLAEKNADAGSGLVDPVRFYAFCAGADAMLKLLLPCVSALEAVEPLTDLADVSDALTALREKLEGTK